MAGLTQEDILALKEIFKPQFEALGGQMVDLKTTMTQISDANRQENDRRRDDIGRLYDQDRARSAENADLSVRVAALEMAKAEHDRDHEKAVQAKQFTIGQAVAGLGVLVVFGLWFLDRFFPGGGGK